VLSVLNAGFLPWLFAISIPVVIHLLTRRTRRRLNLPTVRFLQKSLANQSQFWRWRHLVTLLLRTLAIAALVFAFLKPSWLSAFAATSGEKAGIVIVVDDSASMEYSASGVSTFSRAKEQVREILDGLHDGDKANIVFGGAQPTLATEAPTADHTALAQALQSSQVTEERADAAGAVNIAIEQLSKTNATAQKLYLVSDFQRTNWGSVRFDSVPASTHVLFVDVGAEHRENLGLTSLRLRPATPRVGETATVQAEVFNSSDSSRTVPVDLKLSDGRHFTDRVTVGAYSSGNVSFPLTFDKAERIELTATLPDDNLAADNVRRAVVDLRQMATVVLLTDEDVDAPTSAAFYLSRALHPDPSSNAGFRVITVHPTQLNNPQLKSADAVIVCNTPSMPQVQYEALARYVTGGGSLVWMLYGDRVQEELAGFGARLPKAEPLPLKLQSLANISGQAKGFVSLAEARSESRMLKAFSGSGAALTAPKFFKFWITSEVDQRGEQLLRFEDGTAAAVHTGEGSGNLLLLNMSPAPSYSDLARQDIFVPLLHEFLKGIVNRDAGQREANPGGPAATTIAPTKAAVLAQDPDGKPIIATMDKPTGSVVIEKTGKSGFYHVLAGGEEAASIAVNPSADESDLRSIDPRELESKRQKQVAYLAAAGGNGANLSDLQHGLELWPYLLVLALVMLLLEQVVRRVGFRRSAKADGRAS